MFDSLGAGTMEGTQEGLFAFLLSSTPSGGSISYRSFTDLDTNTGGYLNDPLKGGKPFKIFGEENAEGIEWILSYAADTATVYARTLTTRPGIKIGPMAATVTGNSVFFDFPRMPVFTKATWVFNAETKKNGLTDVTSGVLVFIDNPLAS